MSFFRNIRSSITRSHKSSASSSRDTTPVRQQSGTGKGTGSRRNSNDSRADSIFNRSDTFILNPEEEEEDDVKAEANEAHDKFQNNSKLEKKPSKKSKVLSKFNTFTKRKKAPSQTQLLSNSGSINSDSTLGGGGGGCEHHPSDNATNTYYKWQSEGGSGASLEYDAQTDPFNFLYEQNGSTNGYGTRRSSASINSGVTTPGVPPPQQQQQQQQQHQQQHTYNNYSNHKAEPIKVFFDSATYRKPKRPSTHQSKTESITPDIGEKRSDPVTSFHSKDNSKTRSLEEREDDKYRTITLNSFRRSFREKLLQQQQESPYNPSWFVDIEPPQKPLNGGGDRNHNNDGQWSKENRPDFLIFDNDNYRPGSQSPVRDRAAVLNKPISPTNQNSGNRRQSRSPVKRNETFYVNRTHNDSNSVAATPSIRVEIKNSISPHIPGRLVPVGVAKPMPSGIVNATTGGYSHISNHSHQNGDSKTGAGASWSKAVSTVTAARNVGGRTLVQIRNDANIAKTAAAGSGGGHHATRIQLGESSKTGTGNHRFLMPASRHSLAALPSSTTTTTQLPPLTSYEMLRHPAATSGGGSASRTLKSATAYATTSSAAKQPLKQTYFGAPASTTTTSTGSKTAGIGGGGSRLYAAPLFKAPTASGGVGGLYSRGGITTTTTTNTNNHQHYLRPPSMASSSYYTNHNSNNNINVNANNKLQTQRIVVPTQRRSRSPIKIPWR